MRALAKVPDLLALAAQHGIDIVRHHDGEKGRWYPARRTISLRVGLPARAERCTLAHELGHAVLEHDAGGHLPRWLVEKQERAADRWAANLLIDAREYAHLETIYEGHLGAIAAEMGVTVSLLATWRDNQDMSSAASPESSAFGAQ